MARKHKIILVGGGTLGSVSPLLAIAAKYEAEYLFVGTQDGPEQKLISNIKFVSIKSGKLRRYFSWQNFTDAIKIKLAFFQSIKIIKQFKPDLILTAGSFVAVPMAWAGWVLRVPVIVHQQDIKIGLANRLMLPCARKITVIFSQQKNYFNNHKVVVTGNPVREYKVKSLVNKPMVVITGGGLGARGLNTFIAQFIPMLLEKYEVHHILGEANHDQRLELPGYHSHHFITDQMMELLSQADLIISRAGMSLITEAAYLKKPLILVPIPKSHQEQNATFLAKHNAAFVVKQGSKHVMHRYLSKLMSNDSLKDGLGNNLYQLFPKNAVDKYIKLIKEVLEK